MFLRKECELTGGRHGRGNAETDAAIGAPRALARNRSDRRLVKEFIAAHSAPVALRDGILYVRVLQPALHYELEQISKSEILRKLKQRFGGKTIRDVRFRVG